MFRHKSIEQYKTWEQTFHVYANADTLDMNEWVDIDRVNEQAWQARYDYESHILAHFINEAKLTNKLCLS